MANIPTITFPTSSPGYSTNLQNQVISGNVDYVTKTFPYTSINVSTKTFNVSQNGLLNNSALRFTGTTGTLPTGITANVTYYVINASTNSFQISSTLGGSAVNILSQGSGNHTIVCSPITNIYVNDTSENVTYILGETTWAYSIALSDGENILNVKAKDVLGDLSSAVTITITYTSEQNLNLFISPPTGITLSRSKDSIKIAVVQNPETEVIGYNFYGSEYVGGGLNGFTLLNSSLITEPDFFQENATLLSETVSTSGDIRTTNTIQKIDRQYYYSYTHNRTTQSLGTLPISEPNHYVATAVAFDNVLQQQVESSYSAELGAAPLLLDTSIRDLPKRTTFDIQKTLINEMLTVDPNIDVKPGTPTRDVYINPPSDEFERLYIIQDFMHRSQSFLTLLDFDDANGDGISDEITKDASPLKWALKTALLLSDENAATVQQIVDDAFTKLAGNVNITRKTSNQAIGQALFYTRRTPTKDVVINAGAVIETVSDETTSAIQFSVLTNFTLTLAELDSYYNSTTNRYEVTLDIQAVNAGAAGNVDAEKIRVVVSGVDPIFGVTNPNPTEFGQDIESNRNLAERAILAFSSVDAGTKSGYLATTLGTTNVDRAVVISAGDALMQRDIDPLRLVHTYGKVDIYVQGSIAKQYTDTFGFTYKTVKKQAALISSVSMFQFTVVYSGIDITHPIFEVLEVRNVTKSSSYDITGYAISGDGDVIDLDGSNTTNILIGLSPYDKIEVSFRYRDSDPYIFKNQPVEYIYSVVGENSGALTSANYILQQLEDPLTYGRSTISSDQMSIVYANNVPNGYINIVVDEAVLLTEETESELQLYGVDGDSVSITDSLKTITYVVDVDYSIFLGGASKKTTIKRISTGAIPNSSTVLVSYKAGEQFTVVYNVNSLLTDVQARVDIQKHLTADVITKSALQTYLDFDFTVILEAGSNQTSIDKKIRTALAKLLTDKKLGQGIYQSDVIRIIEETQGVDHVIVPFTKMVKANNSIIIREILPKGWSIYQTGTHTSYKSNSKLSWSTSEGGGPDNYFKGVFESDILLAKAESAAAVSEGSGRFYIDAQGYVYVTPNGNVNEAQYTVTYIVQNATGARDIILSSIEYSSVGTLSIVYDFLR